MIPDVFGDDLDAVRESVRPFERRRAIMDSHVAAYRVRVPFGMIGRTELAGHQFLRPTISRKTLPVMKATFAGRSASQRMR